MPDAPTNGHTLTWRCEEWGPIYRCKNAVFGTENRVEVETIQNSIYSKKRNNETTKREKKTNRKQRNNKKQQQQFAHPSGDDRWLHLPQLGDVRICVAAK